MRVTERHARAVGKVAARIENEAGDAGIIGASGPLDSEFVEMSYLSKNAYIKPGQIVKTSGDGGIFPKDIPVGKVADSRPAEYGLATVARVKRSNPSYCKARLLVRGMAGWKIASARVVLLPLRSHARVTSLTMGEPPATAWRTRLTWARPKSPGAFGAPEMPS